MECPLPRAPFLVVDLRDSPEFVRRGRAKAEELEIGWNLLEQHVGADLDFAATRPCPAARNGVISCFITTSPTKVEGAIRSTSIGQRVAVLHAKGRRVDDNIEPGRDPWRRPSIFHTPG